MRPIRTSIDLFRPRVLYSHLQAADSTQAVVPSPPPIDHEIIGTEPLRKDDGDANFCGLEGSILDRARTSGTKVC